MQDSDWVSRKKEKFHELFFIFPGSRVSAQKKPAVPSFIHFQPLKTKKGFRQDDKRFFRLVPRRWVWILFE